MYEIKTADVHEDFSSDKQMFNFSNYLTNSTNSKYYDSSNKLVTDKTENKTNGPAIKEFARLNPEMYIFLVDNNTEHKKVKNANRIVVTTINHNKYKDELLN